LRKDGTRISIEFSILPFRNAEGRIVGIGAGMRDVTKKLEETKALRKALAAGGAGLIQQPAELRHVARS